MPSSEQLLLLDKTAVERLLRPDDAIAAVREAFELHSLGQGRVFPVVREALAAGGIFGIKSGEVGSQGLLGFKAAGFWPANRALGGEPHQATILLFDPTTGRPTCMIDGNVITTARTAAAGALGLSLLARQDSRVVTVFGTGVQARAQLDAALRMLPSLTTALYVSADRAPRPEFASFFKERCELLHAQDADTAVSQSDVVITATPGKASLFSHDAIRPGTHFNCVGTDTKGKRELPDGALELGRVVADDLGQARQLGELQWAPAMQAVEIGALLTRATDFLRKSDEITFFDLTGLALQDLTVARLLHHQAIEHTIGTTVSWPW